MLIDSPNLTDEQRAGWGMYARQDTLHAMSTSMRRKEEEAKQAIREFLSAGPAYLGVSWGKDSVVVAKLVMDVAPETPMVWVRVQPTENPDCPAVRDAWLKMFPACNYHEVEVWCKQVKGKWKTTGTLKIGLGIVESRFGHRHISGVRAQESRTRTMRAALGVNTKNSSIPLLNWKGEDVYAFLHKYDLPVHPAYAVNHNGLADRNWLRVASIGGTRGNGMGRAQWEEEAYHNQILDLADGKPPSEQ